MVQHGVHVGCPVDLMSCRRNLIDKSDPCFVTKQESIVSGSNKVTQNARKNNLVKYFFMHILNYR